VLDRATRALRGLALVLSGLFLVELAVLFGLRVGHPYLLEWQEGAMVDQARRILDGHALYVAPSLEFVPQLYAPLYFYVSAAATALLGEGFVPLRVVSIASTVGCLVLAAAFVRRETGDRGPALLAAGFFAATYPLSAAFLDVARVDALFLLFIVAAVYLLGGRVTVGRAVGAALCLWLGFLTKQQALLFAVPMVLYVLLAQGLRPALALALPFGVLAAATTQLFDRLTDGWYVFYLFTVPGGHEIFWPMLLGFWWMDLLRPLAPACGVALAWLVVLWRGGPAERGRLLFWLLFLGGAVGISWGSRMHWGGATNVVLPAYLAIALVWGVALARWTRAPTPPRVRAGVAALAVVQLLWLVHDPRPLVPTEADRRAGDAFVRALGGLEGEVLATWHGYLPRLAGKRVYAHRSSLHDVMRSEDAGEPRERLRREIEASLDERRFDAIVVDQPLFVRDYFAGPLARGYRPAGPLLERGLEVGGLLGFRANPRLYLPREPASRSR